MKADAHKCGDKSPSEAQPGLQVAAPAAALQERALAAPAAWAPLAALLVRDYARRIPGATYSAWLQVPHACRTLFAE